MSGNWNKQKEGNGPEMVKKPKSGITKKIREDEAKIPGMMRAKQKQFMPATRLRTTDMADVDPRGIDDGIFNTNNYLAGNWTRFDPKDDRMKTKLELVDPATGKTPFGSANLEQEDIDFWNRKKASMENVKRLELASYLINDNDPSSQRAVWEAFPTLFQVPEEQFLNQLQLQLHLRVLLRDGAVGGEQDLDTLMYILRPDVQLPIGPVWDPSGLILTEGDVGNAFKDYLDARKTDTHGYFNPLMWNGLDAEKLADGLQKDLKATLLKRCFPGFRDWDVGDVIKWIDAFAGGENPTANELIDVKALNNAKYKTNRPLSQFKLVKPEIGIPS
jgi:hypothetical protein